MSAIEQEIIGQIHDESTVAMLEAVKVLRKYNSSDYASVEQVRENLKLLWDVKKYYGG